MRNLYAKVLQVAEQTVITCDWPTEGKACGQIAKQVGISVMDGRNAYVDLCEAHQESLLEPLAGNWRATPSTTGRSRSRYGSNERKPIYVGERIYTAAEARAWLRLRGYEVPPTGRISDEHLAAFTAAMTASNEAAPWNPQTD